MQQVCLWSFYCGIGQLNSYTEYTVTHYFPSQKLLASYDQNLPVVTQTSIYLITQENTTGR